MNTISKGHMRTARLRWIFPKLRITDLLNYEFACTIIHEYIHRLT